MVLCLLVSSRFQVLFHSPPGVLFTFPSRYYSLSVIWSYLAFWDGPHFFRQDSTCPDVLRIPLVLILVSPTGLSPAAVCLSIQFGYQNFVSCCGPYPARISTDGLGFSDFARHYFRNRFYFLFLRVLRCFSSPGSPRTAMCSPYGNATLLALSSLIRISADHKMFAPPRSFSQLTASFFGAIYQGILREPFVA